jgi:hypothetical protein
VGRHTVPGTGTPEPDRGFWVRLAVAAVVVLLVGGYFVLRAGDGDDVETAGPSSPSPSASGSGSSTTAPASSSPPASPTATPSATKTTRPPTLAFTVRYPAYITVRIPGGRTLVSKVFKSGAKASFNQKVLQVVNGRPQAVRFVVNGKPRKPGPPDQAETFTVRRK